MAKVPISATIETTTNETVLDMAKKDNNRSFSAMLNILLCEAIESRKKKNAKGKDKNNN